MQKEMQKEMPEIKPGMLVKVPGSGFSGPRMFPSWLIVLKVTGKYFSGLNIKTATWQDGQRTLGIESTDCLQLNSIMNTKMLSFPRRPSLQG